MKGFVLTALLVLLAGFATAATSSPITPEQARANIGQCVTVEGYASLFQDSNRLGIDVDLHRPLNTDQVLAFGGIPPFTAYVPYPGGMAKLESLQNRTVDITGVVEMDGGVPGILLANPDQIMAAGSIPGKLLTCDQD